MIFISTHSEEEHNDLFAGEEGPQTKPRPVAVKVDQFFSALHKQDGPPSQRSYSGALDLQVAC
ncbi:hypothetical protein PAXRUDRAFT_18105 [Paxillus rubicundulus Ve08.2h10]|uniref:Uncharacterized protein n=1 Tax=Paxillus rubicundulus Ve08.2h10 TaxID=930991 RepID=A0A0D0CZ81_9AGAM|nr:hypothetical protein PAXRUDRAFT_18105 [Paxillus rubicundulus Ve08.2h10]